MGFNSVFRTLQEVFPQMENRLLRAVAIEYPKDADVAVKVVLTRIIPRLDQQNVASSSSNSGGSSGRKAKFYSASPVSLGNFNEKDSDMNRIANDNMHFGQQNTVGHSILDSNMSVSKASSRVKQCSDGNSLEIKNVMEQLLMPAEESTLNASEGNLQLVSGTCDYTISELTDINSMDAESFAVKKPTEFKDESAPKPLVDGSGEVCRIDMLEGFIEDAEINKKTLVSALVLVTSMVKEIKILEKKVEDTKKRAASRCWDILTRIEDFEDIIEHAKEANEMHAGEVYGEKDILDAEVMGVQSRLIYLSLKQDNSNDILDQMHCKLGERLAEAEKVMNTAEVEMVEKEKLAKNALAEQQLILVKMTEESKKINQEEEDAKLWKFHMDSCLAVNMLEEKVGTICQDVKLPKGKINETWVPFGESVEHVQFLGKEVDTDFVRNEPSDTLKESSSSSSSNTIASARDDSKAIIEDEWDLCDP